MKKVWVINSSPLIVLGKISQLSLLLKLADEVVVPEGVAAEVGRGPDGDPARIWLEAEGSNFVRMVGEPDPTVATWDLGLGESHLLILGTIAQRVRGNRGRSRCQELRPLSRHPSCGNPRGSPLG